MEYLKANSRYPATSPRPFGRESARGHLVGVRWSLEGALGFLHGPTWSGVRGPGGDAGRWMQGDGSDCSFPSSTREAAAARSPAPEPSLPAQEEVHTWPPRCQPHVCLLRTTLHPPVLQNCWQDGSWLHQGLGPWGKYLGGAQGFSGPNLACAVVTGGTGPSDDLIGPSLCPQVDLGHIYGDNLDRQYQLRLFKDGKLKYQVAMDMRMELWEGPSTKVFPGRGYCVLRGPASGVGGVREEERQ